MAPIEFENWTDEQLMEAYQKGETAPFEELYQRYSKRIYGFLKPRCNDPQTADDVFQATFQKLHANRSRYESRFPFSAWIFTLCRNLLYDQLRKTQRSRETTSQHFDELLSKTPSEAPNETKIESIPHMENLSESQRKAVELRFNQDLPFEEIAERLGTSPANARQLVSRGLRRLRKLLIRKTD